LGQPAALFAISSDALLPIDMGASGSSAVKILLAGKIGPHGDFPRPNAVKLAHHVCRSRSWKRKSHAYLAK
jgi:hypothetical protein